MTTLVVFSLVMAALGIAAAALGLSAFALTREQE